MDETDIRDRLDELPRRAAVAFAARCARRVQPLTHALLQQDRDAIDRAIVTAEAFAKGDAEFSAEDAAWAAANATWAAAKVADAAEDAAWAAAWAAKAAARDAAEAAARAAANATWAARAAAGDDGADTGAAARAAAASDLDRLSAWNLGPPDTLGAPIDPSEAGPLGPLWPWPPGGPKWDTKAGTLTGSSATGTATPKDAASVPADPAQGRATKRLRVIAWVKRLVSGG